MKIKLKKDAAFKENFKKKSSEFRIAAVIHDGQWYDKEKWSTVSMSNIEDIEKYISDNKDILIEKNNSYRTNIEEIIKWYEENSLDLEEPLVPGNFIPKLWGGKTETQQFIDTPKRVVNTLLIDCSDSDTKELVKSKLKGYSKIIELDKRPVIRVYTVSTDFIEEYLKKNLPQNIIDKLSFRKRTNVLWRDLSDFDYNFLQEVLDFYTNYAKGLLKPHSKTMEIFLPISYDRDIQIQDWILRAIDKFDETGNVPFSGYLASVLQRWPYDLPNDELGIELAKFQRNRNKALNLLLEEYLSENPPEEEVRLLTEYDKEDYYRLLEEHNQWLALKSTTALNWEDKNQEKRGRPIFSSKESNEVSPEFSHKLTMSILKAAIDSQDIDSLEMILDNYTDEIKDLNVKEDFKKALWENFYEEAY